MNNVLRGRDKSGKIGEPFKHSWGRGGGGGGGWVAAHLHCKNARVGRGPNRSKNSGLEANLKAQELRK